MRPGRRGHARVWVTRGLRLSLTCERHKKKPLSLERGSCDPCVLGFDFGGFATILAHVRLGLGLVVEVSLAASLARLTIAGVAHVCCATCFGICLLEFGFALSTLHTSLRLRVPERVYLLRESLELCLEFQFGSHRVSPVPTPVGASASSGRAVKPHEGIMPGPILSSFVPGSCLGWTSHSPNRRHS